GAGGAGEQQYPRAYWIDGRRRAASAPGRFEGAAAEKAVPFPRCPSILGSLRSTHFTGIARAWGGEGVGVVRRKRGCGRWVEPSERPHEPMPRGRGHVGTGGHEYRRQPDHRTVPTLDDRAIGAETVGTVASGVGRQALSYLAGDRAAWPQEESGVPKRHGAGL